MTLDIPAFARDDAELRGAVRSLLEGHSGPTVVREAEEHPERWSPNLWDQVVAGGWHGLTVPEEVGGAGIGFADLHLVLYELGRANAAVPFRTAAVGVASYLGAVTTNHPEALAIVHEVLEGKVCVPAVNELAPVEALPVLEDGVVRGEVLLVRDAAHAASFLVAAQGPEADVSWVQVDAEDPTVSVTPQPSLGGDSVARLRFDGSSARRIVPSSSAQLRVWTTLRWFAEACWLSGVMARALEHAVAHVKEREQFGRSVGTFQAVQHQLADAAIGVQSVAHSCRAAAAVLDGHGLDHPDSTVSCAESLEAVRLYGRVVSTNAHQVMAGTGYALEHDLQLSTRRLRAGMLWGADSDLIGEIILSIRYPETAGGR